MEMTYRFGCAARASIFMDTPGDCNPQFLLGVGAMLIIVLAFILRAMSALSFTSHQRSPKSRVAHFFDDVVELLTFIKMSTSSSLETFAGKCTRSSQLLRPTPYVWHDEFPVKAELQPLFDRADAMLGGVLVAIMLQSAHPRYGPILEAHSAYRKNPWRRLIRTLLATRVVFHGTSEERGKLLLWLNKIHGGIPVYGFDANLFIVSTLAYGLAKAHKNLGNLSDERIDLLVSIVMQEAHTLSKAGPNAPSVPQTLSEVEKYLKTQHLSGFEKLDVIPYITENLNMTSCAARLPHSFLSLVSGLARDIFLQIIVPSYKNNTLFGRTVRFFQPLLANFHVQACPGFLTLDGLFRMLFAYDPSYAQLAAEFHVEVFGESSPLRDDVLPYLRRFASSSSANTPEVLKPRSLFRSIVDKVRCARLRGEVLILRDAGKLPKHLGVIMDGNRRYSKEQKLVSVADGHRMGARKLIECVPWCYSAGIRNMTVWALSTENLQRSEEETGPLFETMARFVREMSHDEAIGVFGIRIRAVGDLSVLPERLVAAIRDAEHVTRKNRAFNLQLAIGYGGRTEVLQAFKCALRDAVSQAAGGEDAPTTMEEALEGLTAYDVGRFVYSAQLGLPEIDAIMRTSGEVRTSGFALWESQKAEMLFLQEHWPALDQATFLLSVVELASRNRRYGV